MTAYPQHTGNNEAGHSNSTAHPPANHTAADKNATPQPRSNKARHPQRTHRTNGKKASKQHDDARQTAPTIAELREQLDEMTTANQRRFRARLHKARSPQARRAIANDIARARADYAAKLAAIPPITYPEQLPVTARRDDIAEAINTHQVVIIAGETGSGKTTQIPKICLELGRGRHGMIGHTQPRRLAARTVAERIADELAQPIGTTVGYAIRFDDRVSNTTAIKLMTDGILLTEMTRDRYLNAYDTIIIDEAHERSLNIDFLLGYLKEILPKRPDLKVIITSATIDPERFANHFTDSAGNPAPIIEVSGRTYPVEIRYRPLVHTDADGKEFDIDPIDGLLDALKELMREGSGDILCFFAGEADIRDAQEAIEGAKFTNVEVVPLFGRLSNQDQHKVFRPHSRRRIVLATNIAETSLTVPGIHYVVDTGFARISRYSSRTKVQRLPIEPISQASAQQRSGRCGRVADGVAIRLYSEQDFLARPEFTDPEILRTSLAAVILQMAALRLGDITEFPFIEPPETKQVRDGLLLLHELGALDNQEVSGGPKLTDIGRALARIPVDPRMGRMLYEARTNGVLYEVMIIVAALTIQDVRERPLEFQAQADQAHARFHHATSDFLAYLQLWRYLTSQRAALSGNQFRKTLAREYLHYMRVREWFDLLRQLNSVVEQLGWNVTETLPETVDEDRIHQSLLAGLLSHIGVKQADSKEYAGARNTKFMIFPGSRLAKKPPQAVMAAELVETSRLWARDVGKIQLSWVESLAPHLLRHNYSEPHWSTKRRAAMVYQKSTLYGVTVVTDRLVPYHRVDPHAARSLFIRHALVYGEWSTHHEFFHNNRRKLDEAVELEEKARRRDIVVDEDTLFDFYDAKLPASITTGTLFDHWWKKQRRSNPALLDFDPDALIADADHDVTEVAFPDRWRQGSIDYELRYHFAPGAADDGVTVAVAVPLLGNIRDEGFDWLVPGLREELVTELIRTLPKPLRRTVVPAPEYARRALDYLKPYHGTITEQLGDILRSFGAAGIDAQDFQPNKLPPHLQMSFAAIDKSGKVIDRDRDLSALKSRNQGQISSSLGKVAKTHATKAAPNWDERIGDVAEEVTTTVDGQHVTAFPALTVTAAGVEVVVYPTKAQADAALLTANLTLLSRAVTISDKQMVKGLPLQQRVAIDRYPHGGLAGLVEDAKMAVIRDLLMQQGEPARTLEAFEELKTRLAPEVPKRVRQVVVALAPGIAAYVNMQQELQQWQGPAIDEMIEQLAAMLPPHAIARFGATKLIHLPRYIEAMQRRLELMSQDPDRDADLQDQVLEAQQYLAKRLEKLPANRANSAAAKEIFWMIEELRVSLFAQQLKTPKPVSVKRIQKAVDKLR
ncbi:ATP-dependent RNA helicase HrpA [Corynebacterium choanae]|uniref:ATP-dependent RNA helicase HrpB n=1 Tax=Corynebacterium choanae TaxID=1862358 RepID=A0A3G6J7A6_9CORY|nr:ATP-dependent RNA helicase HrpA [Corynebacterium choanae]AZA13759.1 ATP-dependent RNA helicase HrpB [Corynebacterium choanae]